MTDTACHTQGTCQGVTSMARCFAVFEAPHGPKTLDSVRQYSPAVDLQVGACVNHSSEVKFSAGFNHAVSGSMSTAQAKPMIASLSRYLEVNCKFVQSLVLHYEPNETLVCSEHLHEPVKHIFFASFKAGAPMEELITGYSGLPSSLEMMKAFEWGQLQPDASAGYEYIFMTTFENEAGRDAYLAHPVHEAFAKDKMFPWIDRIVIMDFIEGYDGVLPRKPRPPTGSPLALTLILMLALGQTQTRPKPNSLSLSTSVRWPSPLQRYRCLNIYYISPSTMSILSDPNSHSHSHSHLQLISPPNSLGNPKSLSEILPGP